VSEDHDTEACREGIEVELGDVVEHIDGNTVYPKHLGLRDRFGPFTFVVVATHDRDWSEILERLNHSGVANVARVNDEIAAAKKLDRLGPQEAVSIRDESNTRHRVVRRSLRQQFSGGALTYASALYA
jgi:hypothetical protein